MPDLKTKLALMVQPENLKSTEYQPWCRGRGVDVWAMLCASIAGDLETIKRLVAGDRKLLTCEMEYFQPIRFAVRENHRPVVDFLFANGVNPAYESGDSLVKIAHDREYHELEAFLTSLLMERFHIVPEGRDIAAHIRSQDAKAVQALIEQRPEFVHAADDRGNQPIHWAVLTRQLGLIDFLLSHGADINARRPDGARPLDLTNGDYHYRSWYRDLPPSGLQKHEVLIGYLLARGADYDISVAAKVGDHARVLELLNLEPELVNRVPPYCSYYSGLPLRCAAQSGHLEVAKLLLERGANPNEPEFDIAPFGGALHTAVGKKHLEIVKLLLERGANPNAEIESSGNCLMMAQFAGAPQEIHDLLVSYGAKTPPSYGDDNLKVLETKLKANPGKPIDAETLSGLIGGGHQKCVELILQGQPDALATTPDSSPWWSPGLPKSPEFARWLLEHGLDANRRNWLGITPLHRCAAGGNIDMAKVFLEFGADINAIESDSSCTPLALATRRGKKAMVELLLERGANPDLPDDEVWARPGSWQKRMS